MLDIRLKIHENKSTRNAIIRFLVHKSRRKLAQYFLDWNEKVDYVYLQHLYFFLMGQQRINISTHDKIK